MTTFDYSTFVQRNMGFVNQQEQEKLANARVFVPGLGGMGGLLVSSLVRMGIGNLTVADADVFEHSNMNRQIFATTQNIGEEKAKVTERELTSINPSLNFRAYGFDWPQQLEEILSEVDLVVNACDDMQATTALYRAAKAHGITVIDAFPSMLPNVFVTGPQHPRPEEWLNYPTQGRELEQVRAADWKASSLLEMEYVLTHTPSKHYIEEDLLQEVLSGERSKPSFAPMVWMSACLMSYEVVKLVLGRGNAAHYKGLFWDPWKLKVV